MDEAPRPAAIGEGVAPRSLGFEARHATGWPAAAGSLTTLDTPSAARYTAARGMGRIRLAA